MCGFLCCCDGLGQSRLLGAPRCLRGPSASGQKLLAKSRPCDPPGPTPSEPSAPSAPAAAAPAPRLSGSNHSGSPKPGTKRLPQALIVGVKKGGTRAVLEFIRVHPDVRALGTEPHFFDRNYGRGLDWYSVGVFLGLCKTSRNRICPRGNALSKTERGKHRMKSITLSSSWKSVTHL
ncbi:mCG52197 [Mus musculus]|uniref:Isoform 2 of Heparan sulfate glucosamine 3-O-sulfotransferase 2 n=1 Tax=Mus musculus TaxID=10090 RepID=Q673U1-2|nr:mCG52197 [Mus musculus]BAC31718.1 unnamed protein product [Mus musculus]